MTTLSKRNMDTDAVIGANLKRVRISRGWSQEKLGEALGITFQQIQKYEKGTNRVAVSTLLASAKALGVTPAAILPELATPADADLTVPTAAEYAMIRGLRDLDVSPAKMLDIVMSIAEAVGGQDAAPATKVAAE